MKKLTDEQVRAFWNAIEDVDEGCSVCRDTCIDGAIAEGLFTQAEFDKNIEREDNKPYIPEDKKE